MMQEAILDSVTQEFIRAFQQDATLLQHAAARLFYHLALIQLTISSIWMTFKGENLQAMFVKWVQLAIGFGVFYALMQYGGYYVPLLLNGFIEIGQQTGVQSINPSSIVDQGVLIASHIFHGFYGWGMLGHPFVSIVGAVACISVIIIYGFIAAELAIILIKAYLLASLSSLFFAFGASDYTRAMSINYVKTLIGIGLQLMTLYLLLSVGQNIGAHWAELTRTAVKEHALMPMLVILSASTVFYLIIKNIPPFIANLSGVGGFRNYGDAAVGMALNAGITGANRITNTVAGTGSASQAFAQVGKAGLQSLQAGFSDSSHIAGLHKYASTFTSATGHLAKTAMKASKDSIMQEKSHMSFGQKVNHHLNETRGNQNDNN